MRPSEVVQRSQARRADQFCSKSLAQPSARGGHTNEARCNITVYEHQRHCNSTCAATYESSEASAVCQAADVFITIRRAAILRHPQANPFSPSIRHPQADTTTAKARRSQHTAECIPPSAASAFYSRAAAAARRGTTASRSRRAAALAARDHTLGASVAHAAFIRLSSADRPCLTVAGAPATA